MKFLNSAKTLCVMSSLSLLALPALAQEDNTPIDRADEVDRVVEERGAERHSEAHEDQAQAQASEANNQENDEERGPTEDVREVADVLKVMQEDPDLRRALEDSEGVFVIPDYVTAALIIGGAGGEGVLLTRDEEEWKNPAFYNIGELDIGAQAGASVGTIAMILNNEEALNNFKEDTSFSLDADAGYSIVNWSERVRGELGEHDVIVWSDTQGLLGELSVGVTGITFDDEQNEEYYGQQAAAPEILEGDVEDPQEQMLQQALREE